MKLAWLCDERDRKACRNPHGCHCSEITHLIAARDKLTADRDRTTRNRDMWKGQCEQQADKLRKHHGEKPTRGGLTCNHDGVNSENLKEVTVNELSLTRPDRQGEA